MSATKPPRPAKSKSSIKAEKVLDAAQRVFSQYGYGATSMDTLAQVAGVSKATVYAHFGSKKALFAAMVRAECQRSMAEMAIPAEEDGRDLRETLTRIGHNFLRLILRPRVLAIFRVVIAETPRFPELGRIFYASGPELTLAGVARYLERADSQGQIATDDPQLAAHQFLGMLRGDLHLRGLLGVADTPPMQLQRIADQAVEAFLRAYAP